jgi:folate-dependent phosphoribosylglycinamide formyltransferase PurN
MKILMLCSSQGNQKALAHKINNAVSLDYLILCNYKNKSRRTFFKFLLTFWAKLSSILTFLIFRRAWFRMLNYYDLQFKDFPIAPKLIVEDINDIKVINLIKSIKPDLVVVSGTNLLKYDLINEIHTHGKVINLHTGVSPYVKGGPNCTNWCLFLREFYLIGNTVMWLDKGIDSGNLIATEITPLIGNESLIELHIKVMEHAHSLYIRSIVMFVKGNILPNVSQNDFDIKRLFLSKHWGLYEMVIAIFNYYVYYYEGSIFLNKKDHVILVDGN